MNGITWRTAAKFSNWLHNDKASSIAALQDGAYDTSTFTTNPNQTFNDQLTHHPVAKFWIPTLDEWIKAAHYDPNRYGPGEGGYWEYKTAAMSLPSPAFRVWVRPALGCCCRAEGNRTSRSMLMSIRCPRGASGTRAEECPNSWKRRSGLGFSLTGSWQDHTPETNFGTSEIISQGSAVVLRTPRHPVTVCELLRRCRRQVLGVFSSFCSGCNADGQNGHRSRRCGV